ncbi:MAG: hypothetical protein F6K09_07645 [Merismopedia sp. SIO2A8]|nr:hypothetical protein [Merismopedia sp. SIO2A8]
MVRLVFPGLLLTSLSSCALIQSQIESSSSESAESASAEVTSPTTNPVPSTEASSDLGASEQPASQDATTSSSQELSSQEDASPQPDTYPDALQRASSAATLSESAQSRDDWRLVAGRWQQAINLLLAVPASSPNYGNVTAKLADYRRNLTIAQQKSNQPLPNRSQTGSVVVISPSDNSEADNSDESDNPDNNVAPALTPNNTPEPDASNSSIRPEQNTRQNTRQNTSQLYEAPIVRRSGGTPVIHVLFNGEYTVEMIVDTGASGTVLTQSVAQSLGIRPTGQTQVSTASAQNVTFSLGEVDSIEVDGAKLNDVTVAIAGPSLDTGLLGHDFFGRYDVTIREDVVEFRER